MVERLLMYIRRQSLGIPPAGSDVERSRIQFARPFFLSHPFDSTAKAVALDCPETIGRSDDR
jgi:hypothetical protein